MKLFRRIIPSTITVLPVCLAFLLAGCSAWAGISSLPPTQPAPTNTPGIFAEDTVTPFQPLPTATITPTPTVPPEIPVWIPEWVPEGITSSINLAYPYVYADREVASAIKISVFPKDVSDFTWVYALVAPFPTITDGINFEQLKEIWSGASDAAQQILVTESTDVIFSELWGESNSERIRIAKADEMLEAAWSTKNTWAIIPFEEITPRWKVLRINGLSPLDRGLDLAQYPLVARLNWEGRIPVGSDKVEGLRTSGFQGTNRDENKLTRVLLTGTTALVRITAERMEAMGVDYPIGDVLPWLLDADFTHISNEISFNDQCTPAIAMRLGTRFCSPTNYIEVLELIDADVIELTGNHLIDYGREALSLTLDMYAEREMATYGGGRNLNAALQPLIIEHNGNRIAFLGCNRAGPSSVWATDEQPGAAPCDLELMAGQIQNLLDEGILPIVTFQHYELEDTMPISLARQEMQQMAEAGAVVVSGSQAHFPHGFAFFGDHFVHYGLGNLFFDQMFTYNRREFLDRHSFYDGHYLGVELLTAQLEDFARPRPMTEEERIRMLTTYFEASGMTINDQD